MTNPQPDDDHTCEEEGPDAPVMCPYCMALNTEDQDFCHACGGPLTTHASIAPLEHVYAYGHGVRNLVDKRPSPLMLLGAWLIFGPIFLLTASQWINLTGLLVGYDIRPAHQGPDLTGVMTPESAQLMAEWMIRRHEGIDEPPPPVTYFSQSAATQTISTDIGLWVLWLLLAGWMLINLLILIKVTQAWRRRPRLHEDDEQDDEGEALAAASSQEGGA